MARRCCDRDRRRVRESAKRKAFRGGDEKYSVRPAETRLRVPASFLRVNAFRAPTLPRLRGAIRDPANCDSALRRWSLQLQDESARAGAAGESDVRLRLHSQT